MVGASLLALALASGAQAEQWLLRSHYSDNDCSELHDDEVPVGAFGACQDFGLTDHRKVEVLGSHATILEYNSSDPECAGQPAKKSSQELNICTAKALAANCTCAVICCYTNSKLSPCYSSLHP